MRIATLTGCAMIAGLIGAAAAWPVVHAHKPHQDYGSMSAFYFDGSNLPSCSLPRGVGLTNVGACNKDGTFEADAAAVPSSTPYVLTLVLPPGCRLNSSPDSHGAARMTCGIKDDAK